MMEHSCFDFGPLGVEKKVSTLEDFFHFVDAGFDFSAFADLLLVCAKDVVTGLAFLHTNGIVQRDLKPGNTLVCNQHYDNQRPNSAKLVDYVILRRNTLVNLQLLVYF